MKKVKLPNPVTARRPSGDARKERTQVAKKAATRRDRAVTKPRIGRAKVSTKKRRPVKAAGKATKGRGGVRAVQVAPALAIRKLDPLRVCGERTSVMQLFRVDETTLPAGKAASSRRVHLVFNDRHGWYCEHGRSCHAVSAVMRHAGIR
jgi:hypothetical protein